MFNSLSAKTKQRVNKDLKTFNGANDAAGLINYFINSKGKSKHTFIEHVIFNNPKVKKLLQLLANASNRSADFEKRRFLSIVWGAGFTLKKAQQAGFKCFNDAWHTAGVHMDQTFPEELCKKLREDLV